MKLFIIILVTHSCLLGAAITESDLIGTWAAECISSQMTDNNGNTSGYVKDTYQFIQPEKMAFTRKWYKSSSCTGKPFSIISEMGSYKIGEVFNSNNGFVPVNTFKIKLNFDGKQAEKGLIWLSSNKKQARISRGFSKGKQNTMLNLFVFKKIN
ncbi:MAG: hypothetical protein CME62_05855 [Halobacteriovoraceae bacterium]|nr:hypothetical protein [Halobacteriovoraceae bacterium]|tara:strand:- start:34162 stop:34623 length:462 start_codon:yes stop_codon:yes gene_type:complete